MCSCQIRQSLAMIFVPMIIPIISSPLDLIFKLLIIGAIEVFFLFTQLWLRTLRYLTLYCRFTVVILLLQIKVVTH
jgi:hypothetical protein